MKVAYIQALGGASGDMLLASMLDAGLEKSELESLILDLGLTAISLQVTSTQRGGISGIHLDVKLDSDSKIPRRWQDFVRIVEASALSPRVKSQSMEVFRLIGQAEAAVHGVEPEYVHLHELGTLDTLVDVVGVIFGLETLRIEKVFCSALPTGSGTLRSQHGLLPVPAPATAAILRATDAPSYPPPSTLPATGEMLTPTGAAILGTIADFSSPVIQISSTGYGLGTRNPDAYPNALCLTIGELRDINANSDLLILETNIDDSTGEVLGYVQERLFDIGAKDVWYTPIQMKKNRPAVLMSALVSSEMKDDAVRLILNETSTLGIRVRSVERIEADRRIEEFQSSLGVINVKIKVLNGKDIAVSPEYEDCKKIALKKSLSLIKVLDIVNFEASNQILGNLEAF